jgi:transcriptional regulator with XRE-family HTH domain
MVSDIKDLLAFNLRRLRSEQDLTQARLAELLGVEQSTVASWEGRRRWASPENLEDLCRALQVRAWELFAGPDERPTPNPREALKVLGSFVEEALAPKPVTIREAATWRAADTALDAAESRIPAHARDLLEQIPPENKDAWELITATAVTVGKAKPRVTPRD